MDSYFGSFQIAKLLIQRTLALIYLVAFLVALNQFSALLGQNGLMPVPDFIKRVPFSQSPSIFYFFYSDRFLAVVSWLGIIFSLIAFFGISEKWNWWLSCGVWLVLWVLYLSIVNVGQTFYSFGWESMLLEAGFFAAFLGSSRLAPAVIPILILRWMLFRTELGAGLIKLRGDECWRHLTCLFYHYETQPMPNPLSWYFHHSPLFIHRFGVMFSHFVQVIAPFGLFGPQGIASAAGALIIFHQLLLIVSGNYSWLNWLTVILGFAAFSDRIFTSVFPVKLAPATLRSVPYDRLLVIVAILVVILSIEPTLNLFSRYQRMNYNYNPLHLVGSYGAFGAMTKERYEIIIEGTDEGTVTPQTKWKEYEFKGKPGDVKKRPPQYAPYHLRLDWLMWFLPFSVTVTKDGINTYGYDRWFARFIEKLLEGDEKTVKLLRYSPFADKPPHFIRARYYRYRYTDKKERKETGAWWKRTLVGDYMPPVSLSDFRNI